jgi:hypothetical protein
MADYASLLRDHVTLECRSIDRVFLQAWVPKLQSVGQVCTFLRWHRGFKIPSSAAFGAIGEGFVKDIERYAKDHQIPLVRFKKGENKEEFVRPLFEAAAAEGGDGKVVLIGVTARDAGHTVAVGRQEFTGVAKAKAIGETAGFIQFVADADTDRVLGCHIVGPDAGNLVHEAVIAMVADAPYSDIGRAIHIHPTLAEGVNAATGGVHRPSND